MTLSALTHKTGFFQRLATAIGLAACNRKTTETQVRVEEFFRKTRLMLVIDEAHYLWPQHQRSNSNPELVDWVNTALVNQGVPVALVCTDQFVKLKSRIEKRTGWTSEQLEHRVKRYVKLPQVPTKEDLQAVAAKLLTIEYDALQDAWNKPAAASPHADLVKLVVGYGLTSKMRLPAIASLVDEARILARKHCRCHVVAKDVRDAMLEYQIPSDQAMQYAFPDPDLKLKGKSVAKVSGRSIPPRRDGSAAALQSLCRAGANDVCGASEVHSSERATVPAG